MRPIRHHKSLGILVLACRLLYAAPASAYIDNINGSAVPAPQIFFDGIPGIGWYYTPAFSYYLTGISTYFDPLFTGPTRVVSVQIQTERPVNGGTILAQGTFTANNTGGNLGSSFSPLLLEASKPYFVDFSNVDGIGINLGTWQNDGNNVPHPSGGATINLDAWYVDNSNGFASVNTEKYSFAKDNAHVSGSEPILRFDGFVTPEPSSAFLLATGCVGLWLRRQSRFKR